MVDMTFEEIMQAVQKLSPEQKTALLQTLQRETPPDEFSLTRDQAITELEALRIAGVFKTATSMRNRYARPDLNVSDEQLTAYLTEIGAQWEQELDDLIEDD
jgi:hypothetical protein